MSIPSNDIRDVLVADLGYVFSDDLFIGKQPASPNVCATIYDIDDIPTPDLCKSKVDYLGMQILVRGIDYTSAYNAAQAIVDNLDMRSNEEINTTFYIVIRVVNGPSSMGFDKTNRINFSINLEIQRRN